MATFTITGTINIDALTGKTGADIYRLNGGYLTIDQDSRYGLNATTSTTISQFTGSATLGGTVLIDGTNVRLIPFDGGSGNVPVYNTTISIGGASGLMIGVYDSLDVAPTAPGSPMPVDGFIKIKQWNGVAYSAGALSGLTANCTGVDVAGWIEVVGDQFASMILTRLNNCIITGTYYEIGTTDGVRATTYQIPSNGTLQYHAGVEVETSAGSGVYEFYPCAGTQTALVANIATDAVRGKVCWISSAGLLRFGHDGTNSTGGYIVPTGHKIRIANVFLANATTAARTVNVLPSVTLATRFEFDTSGGGVLTMNCVSCSWYLNLTQAYSISLNNVGVLTTIVLSECASPITWNNVNVGQEAANAQIALSLTLNSAGGTITNSIFARATIVGAVQIINLSDCYDFNFTNCTARAFAFSTTITSLSFYAIRCSNFNILNCTLGDAKLQLTTCSNFLVKDSIYYSECAGTTRVTLAKTAFEVATGCSNCVFDGLTFGGLLMNQPFGSILSVSTAACTNIKLRNIGTYASPLDLGDTLQNNVSWTRSASIASITKVAHGLKVNDYVYVTQTSNSTTISVGLRQVTAITSEDIFIIACAASGGPGTLSYYPAVTANLVVVSSAAAGNNIKIQRCYTVNGRGALYTGDNSSGFIIFESVYFNWLQSSVFPALNSKYKAFAGAPAFVAQLSCYGSSFYDGFIADISQNTSAQSWSRVTTTCTVTSNDHRLRTGLTIVVTVSSSTAAVILGLKTITVIDNNTFTFTCLNAGDASGTLTYVPLVNRLVILMNESTADTVDYYTINAGNPSFTSAGGLYMPAVNDEITFETPDYIINYLNFPIAEITGAGATRDNYDITYAIDTGAGYSSFKNLSYPRSGAGGVIGSTTVTMTNTTGVSVGDYVFGTNIGGIPTVVSIDSATNITVSSANIGTVSGVLRFNRLPTEPNIPSTGFKMKVKIKTTTVNTTAWTHLLINLFSNATTRAYQYPLDQYNLTFTGLKNPSEVRIFDSANPTVEIEGQEDVTTGTYTALIDPVEYPTVIAAILSLGYQNIRLTDIDMSEGDVTIPVQQQVDRQYLNP